MQMSFFERDEQIMEKTPPKLLLSLRKEYFDSIVKGDKKYEYRFVFPKSSVRAYIYVPREVKAIMGYMDLNYPIIGGPEVISELYRDCDSGDYFSMMDYIGNRKIACAMKIQQVVVFKKPLLYSTIKSIFPNFCAPQSYIILDKNPNLLNYIEEHL